jgi:hypothetical protein
LYDTNSHKFVCEGLNEASRIVVDRREDGCDEFRLSEASDENKRMKEEDRGIKVV